MRLSSREHQGAFNAVSHSQTILLSPETFSKISVMLPTKPRQIRWSALLFAALFLTGCQTLPQDGAGGTSTTGNDANGAQPMPVKDAATLASEAKGRELDQAIGLYAQGDFAGTITALKPMVDAPELVLSQQLRAIKYLAFSHCLLGQTAPCRAMFDLAFKREPDFQLADTEASHPLWGGEFRRAQTSARAMTNARVPRRTTN
jgi:hypothetical protein